MKKQVKKHPCLGCINNWSGELIGCSDYCAQFESWKRAQENQRIVEELKLLNSANPPFDPTIFEHLLQSEQHDNY